MTAAHLPVPRVWDRWLGRVADRRIAARYHLRVCDVSARRRELGIPAAPPGDPPFGWVEPRSWGRPPAAWHALAGSMPDVHLAEMHGVSRETIRAYRYRHGIPVYSAADSDAILAMLGRVPDGQIAAQTGLPLSSVRNWRAARGIPAPEIPRRKKATRAVAPPALCVEKVLDALRRQGQTTAHGERHHEALHVLRRRGDAWHDGADEDGRGAVWRPTRRR